MLEVEGLTKTFPGGSQPVKAVDNVSLKVKDGQFVSIIGKSGSGKSTLLSLLGALDKPDSGSVKVDGQDISVLSQADLAKYRSRKIGFVFQSYNLIPNLNALENVMLAMELAKELSKPERKERARQLLNQVGVEGDRQQRKPGKLSGGEQQRVAIARAIANKPKLILADEPTGNLDSQTGKMIFDLLHNLAKSENTTILVVTHDLLIAGKTESTFKLVDGKLTKEN
jgi:putative ABC transport system ATP-binding protein